MLKCKIRVAPRRLLLAREPPALGPTQGIWPQTGVAKYSQHPPGSRVPLMIPWGLLASQVFQDQFWRFKESNLVFSRKWRDSLIKSKWNESSGISLSAYIPWFFLDFTFLFHRDVQYLQAINSEMAQDTQKGIFGLKSKDQGCEQQFIELLSQSKRHQKQLSESKRPSHEAVDVFVGVMGQIKQSVKKHQNMTNKMTSIPQQSSMLIKRK